MQKTILKIFLGIGILNACTSPGTDETSPDYLALGDSISMQTFATMSGALQKKIAEEGIESAISYCQIQALPLTAAFANDDIHIRRTTQKPRNPANAPDAFESEMLAYFQAKWENGDSLKPLIKTDTSAYIHYFKPIMLQPLCTSCHGEAGKDIAQTTLRAINAKYPSDQAIGYKAGDLRGLWHITFKKQ